MSSAKVLFPNDEEIYNIIKGLPNAEKLQDKIWESFCLKNAVIQSKNRSPPQRRFKKHPKNLTHSADGDNDADGNCSMDSEDIARALFGTEDAEGTSKCQLALEERLQHDGYDSLDEFCDVTFRNMGSGNKNSLIDQDKLPVAKKIVPSVVPSKAVKMMRPIKARKPILKENLIENTPEIELKQRNMEIDSAPICYDMNKDRRLKTVLQKCNNAMDDIRLLIDIGIPLPDGDEDYLRRKKRALEFSNRFSRIYLYQLNRLLNDIRKLLRPHTTQKALRTSAVQMNLSARTNITHKFIQTLQLVQQSLHAYYNHLPSSIIIGAPEKLKDLLNVCTSICQLHNVVTETPTDQPDGDAANDNIFTPFSTRSKSLLERINECCQIDSATSLLKSDRSKLSLLGYSVSRGRGVGDANSKMQLSVNSSRFSMYGGGGSARACRKDAYWRNAIAALGKKHFNVSSRYKTGKFKHRPDVDRLQSGPNQGQRQPPSFQAFPINLRSSANKVFDVVDEEDAGSDPLASNETCASVNVARRQKNSQFDHRHELGQAVVRRRGRPRYSLNDDNINTVMQNVGEDTATDGREDPKRMRRKSGASCKALQQQNRVSRNHHLNKSDIPDTPSVSPTRSPHLNFSHELIGESSQCDLAPPSIKALPPAPASTTANTSTNIFTCTSTTSLCRLHQSRSFKQLQPCMSLTNEDKAFVTSNCCYKGSKSQPNCCHKCSASAEEQDTCETCHQTVKKSPAKLNNCLECNNNTAANKLKSKPKGDVIDNDWNQLTIDCDRTLRSLDDRSLKDAEGGRSRAVNIKNVIGEEVVEGQADAGVKKDLAKKLAGLVKKSLVKEGEPTEMRDKRREKVTITSVTGAKNAKLICIRDDNSLILDSTTSDIVEEVCQKPCKQTDKNPKHIALNNNNKLLQYANSETQTDMRAQQQHGDVHDSQSRQSNDNRQKRKNVKISRLAKAKVRRPLQMLDKDMSLNIIRYKLDYHKARKENVLYKKTASGVQPWSLMEKVSDGILDHLLLSVAREIQVDDILVKLYESEFYAA